MFHCGVTETPVLLEYDVGALDYHIKLVAATYSSLFSEIEIYTFLDIFTIEKWALNCVETSGSDYAVTQCNIREKRIL